MLIFKTARFNSSNFRKTEMEGDLQIAWSVMTNYSSESNRYAQNETRYISGIQSCYSPPLIAFIAGTWVKISALLGKREMFQCANSSHAVISAVQQSKFSNILIVTLCSFMRFIDDTHDGERSSREWRSERAATDGLQSRAPRGTRISALFTVFSFITYRAKLLNADWFRQRAFFLNFPSMEGKITWSWLAERQNLLAPDWLSAPFLRLVGFLKNFVQNFLTRVRFKFWLLSRLIPLKSMKIRR